MKRDRKHETRDTKLQKQNVTRTILFVVFFNIGAISLGISILSDDLVRYYRSRQLLKAKQEYLDRLRSLNVDYDILLILLEQLDKDPNLFKRIAAATLGAEPADADAIYPKATPEQLTIARRVRAKELDQEPAEPVMPAWLTSCSEPFRRWMLFFSGGALILISFICFRPGQPDSKKQE